MLSARQETAVRRQERWWDSLTIIWHGEAETWAPGDDVIPI